MGYSKCKITVSEKPKFAQYYRSLHENDEVRKKLSKMIDELKINPIVGDQLAKKLWPQDYRTEGFKNVFRYEVDDSTRATYIAKSQDIFRKIVTKYMGDAENSYAKSMLKRIEAGTTIVVELSPLFYSTWDYGKT